MYPEQMKISGTSLLYTIACSSSLVVRSFIVSLFPNEFIACMRWEVMLQRSLSVSSISGIIFSRDLAQVLSWHDPITKLKVSRYLKLTVIKRISWSMTFKYSNLNPLMFPQKFQRHILKSRAAQYAAAKRFWKTLIHINTPANNG